MTNFWAWKILKKRFLFSCCRMFVLPFSYNKIIFKVKPLGSLKQSEKDNKII